MKNVAGWLIKLNVAVKKTENLRSGEGLFRFLNGRHVTRFCYFFGLWTKWELKTSFRCSVSTVFHWPIFDLLDFIKNYWQIKQYYFVHFKNFVHYSNFLRSSPPNKECSANSSGTEFHRYLNKYMQLSEYSELKKITVIGAHLCLFLN